MGHPIGQGSSRRLIDDAQDIEPSDATGVPSRLPLGVVEIRRHGDDRRIHAFAEEFFGDALHLAQDDRRDLGAGECLIRNRYAGVLVWSFEDPIRVEFKGALDFC